MRNIFSFIALLLLLLSPVSAQEDFALSLEQQVAQMFMVTVHGAELPEIGRDFLQRWQPGAMVLFTSNVGSAAAVTRLTNNYQQAMADVDAPPLLIAVDQEGGDVQRLRDGMTRLPLPPLVTATNDPELAFAMGALVAEELRAVGVNMNLAPVADLLTNAANPIVTRRSYGSDPQLTGETISNVLRGMQDNGVLATLKHFPGHGDTSSDSHVDLPVLDLSQERLNATELVPFAMGIEAGVEAVMVAHIWYSTLAPEEVVPASLSPEVVTGLLREQMGFDGIILSDALDMDAIDRRYSYPQAAVMAVQAGADMLATGPGIGLETQAAMMQAVIDAVRSGEIPASRIQESAARVLEAKQRYGLFEWEPLDPATVDARINRVAHEAQIDALYPAATTVVYDRNRLVPAPLEGTTLLIYPASRPSIQATCQAYRRDIRWLGVSQSPTPQDMAWATQAAISADAVIVFTEDAVDNVPQQLLVQGLPPQKTVVVALGSPFDWQYFPEIAAYLLSYSPAPAAVDAVCRVLLADAPAPGVLPVTLSSMLPAGTAAENSLVSTLFSG